MSSCCRDIYVCLTRNKREPGSLLVTILPTWNIEPEGDMARGNGLLCIASSQRMVSGGELGDKKLKSTKYLDLQTKNIRKFAV